MEINVSLCVFLQALITSLDIKSEMQLNKKHKLIRKAGEAVHLEKQSTLTSARIAAFYSPNVKHSSLPPTKWSESYISVLVFLLACIKCRKLTRGAEPPNNAALPFTEKMELIEMYLHKKKRTAHSVYQHGQNNSN